MNERREKKITKYHRFLIAHWQLSLRHNKSRYRLHALPPALVTTTWGIASVNLSDTKYHQGKECCWTENDHFPSWSFSASFPDSVSHLPSHLHSSPYPRVKIWHGNVYTTFTDNMHGYTCVYHASKMKICYQPKYWVLWWIRGTTTRRKFLLIRNRNTLYIFIWFSKCNDHAVERRETSFFTIFLPLRSLLLQKVPN